MEFQIIFQPLLAMVLDDEKMHAATINDETDLRDDFMALWTIGIRHLRAE